MQVWSMLAAAHPVRAMWDTSFLACLCIDALLLLSVFCHQTHVLLLLLLLLLRACVQGFPCG